MPRPYRDGLLGKNFWYGWKGKGARPEIDCCRICGYDLRNRREDYLLCPECNAPNNRTMARRNPDPARQSDGQMAWRYWLPAIVAGAVAFFPGVFLVTLAARGLNLPATLPLRIIGSTLLAVMPTVLTVVRLRTPFEFRGGLDRWPFYLWVSLVLSFGIALAGLVVMLCVPRGGWW